MPITHFLDRPSRHAPAVHSGDRASLSGPPTETVQSQNCLGINYFAAQNGREVERLPRDTPIAISPLTTRDIRVSGRDRRDASDDPARLGVTLSPLIEFARVLIGLAMAVPLAAVVWAVGP